jgi:hypothetical protein
MKSQIILSLTFIAGLSGAETYPVVDTAQTQAYGDRSGISLPKSGEKYYGQDAQYAGHQPSYRDNQNGTVSDLVTGLMWTQDPGKKMSFNDAVNNASKCRVGGYSDWRLPTIKELYSLIQLNGTDPDPTSTDTSSLTPFIDASVFNFTYGKASDGDRIIDSQFASSTQYVSTTMGGNETLFGVNFADGRIKGYPLQSRRGAKTFYVLYVRDNPAYGINKFKNNGDGTVTDEATGLTWMQADSGKGMDWPTALKYAEEKTFAGHADWRLPNAKELQSIIDYSRSPDTTQSAAIDPIFKCTAIKNEGGQKDYAQYWTSTTHASTRSAEAATYFAFGRALGFMSDRRSGDKKLMDVHGAGAQRSDPKTGDASRFPTGRGPQGDVIRIKNMVRLVRGGAATVVDEEPKVAASKTKQPARAKQSNSFIEHEDRNGDGKVSRSEFGGPSAHFDQFDKNGDGYISAAEAPTGSPRERR